jgi:hypothetical protein
MYRRLVHKLVQLIFKAYEEWLTSAAMVSPVRAFAVYYFMPAEIE